MLAQNESERSKLVSFGQTQQRSLYTFLWNLFLADASCLGLHFRHDAFPDDFVHHGGLAADQTKLGGHQG